jgi:hypothetical protein
MTKICTRCQEDKNDELFYKTATKSGRHHFCIECCKARWKKYSEKEGSPRKKKGRQPYIELAEKQCTFCLETKPIEEFSVRSGRKNGRVTRCKGCVFILHKEWSKTAPNTSRNRNLKSKYGITEDDYDVLFESQQNKCAICETIKDHTHKKMAVDHNHKTNKIRGILCTHCNTALGLFKEDPQLLIKAAKYLSV